MYLASISALAAILSSLPGAAAAPQAPAPARRLPAPEHVSPETRHEVRARMSLHAATMQNLVRAVVLLDRPTVRVLANRIADEEIVARTESLRETRRLALPPRYFAEQDELGTIARQLAVAALDGGDDKALADRFSALTRTCVGCHSAYLHDRVEPPPSNGPRPNDAARSGPPRERR